MVRGKCARKGVVSKPQYYQLGQRPEAGRDGTSASILGEIETGQLFKAGYALGHCAGEAIAREIKASQACELANAAGQAARHAREGQRCEACGDSRSPTSGIILLLFTLNKEVTAFVESHWTPLQLLHGMESAHPTGRLLQVEAIRRRTLGPRQQEPQGGCLGPEWILPLPAWQCPEQAPTAALPAAAAT